MTEQLESVAGARIKSFVERVERLEEEKGAITEDIKEVFAEAKGSGFDVKALKKVIKNRKLTREKLEEEKTLEEIYMTALGDK